MERQQIFVSSGLTIEIGKEVILRKQGGGPLFCISREDLLTFVETAKAGKFDHALKPDTKIITA